MRNQNGSLKIAAGWETLLGEGGDAIDSGYVQDYLRFQTPNTRHSFARHIRILGQGERVTLTGAAETHEILERPASKLSAEALPDALREVLRVARNACFHLSSGLDSSLLALLARRMGQDVTAATLRTRGRGAADEIAVVEKLARQEAIRLHVFDFSEMDIWKEGARLMGVLGYPIAHPSHLVRYLLDRTIVEKGLGRRIVTGRGPDEVLGGYAAHLPEYANASRHLARVLCTSESWIDVLFIDKAAGDARGRHQAFVGNGAMPLERRLSYDLGAIFESWNIVEADFARGLDMDYINPFLHRETLALLMSLPEDEKVSGEEQKVFMRRRFHDVYPDYLLSVPKKGLTIDLREYMLGESSVDIVDRIWQASEFAPRLLNRAALQRMVDETLAGKDNHGWQIWSLYLCALTDSKLKGVSQ